MLNYPAAYQSTKGSAMDVDKDFYRRIADSKEGRTLIESMGVPIGSGKAWTVLVKSICSSRSEWQSQYFFTRSDGGDVTSQFTVKGAPGLPN